MITNEQSEHEYFPLAGVKERGWSVKLIDTILGPPDLIKQNPHYRGGPKMKLWEIKRVVEAEANAAFIKHQARRKAQSENTRATADRKREELLAAIESMDVAVEQLPLDELYQMAIDSRYLDAFDDDYESDPDSLDETTLRCWAVTFARQELCEYDQELERRAEKLRADSAMFELQVKVYSAIAAAYPNFAHECHRQLLEGMSGVK